MRSKLLYEIDRHEDELKAESFKESFSLLDRMVEKKKKAKDSIQSHNTALEIISVKDGKILAVDNLSTAKKTFQVIDHNVVSENIIHKTLFKYKNKNKAVFMPNSNFKGYIIPAGQKRKQNIESSKDYTIEAGDYLYVVVDGYEYIASFRDKTIIHESTQSIGLKKETFKPFVVSMVLHAAIFMLLAMGTAIMPKPSKITKKELDRFVSVNIEQLKNKKKLKKKIEKPVEKIVKKKEVKPVKQAKKIEKPKKKRIAAKPRKSKYRAKNKVRKSSPRAISRNNSSNKRVRRSKNPGYGNRPARGKPTPSVASSSLFKSLGSIGSGKKSGGKRALAAVSNIKGVKTGKIGKYNISGSIGKIGGKDVQIVRGGVVQTSGMGSGSAGGRAGRSRATGYIASLGKKASGGSVAGAVVDFPEEEGAILEGQGSLSRAEIFKEIERNASSFRYCYEKYLLKDSSLSGRVVMNWTIDMNGRVKYAKWKSSQIKNRQVNNCLLKRLRALRFPKPRGNSVQVDFPFVFSSAAF